MKKRLRISILVGVGVVVCGLSIGAWVFFPELYFRIHYQSTYKEKGIFAESARLPLDSVEQARKLGPARERESFFIDLAVAGFHAEHPFRLLSGNQIELLPSGPYKKNFVEQEIELQEKQVALLQEGKYSLSLSTICKSQTPRTALLVVSANGQVCYSAPNLSKEDVLTAVIPFSKAAKKTVRIRFINNGRQPVIFERPRLVFTPLYPNFVNQHYREEFNFRKGKRKRIIVIGGSTSYGTGASLNCTWPSILQQKLEYLYPHSVEVLNLSTWGGSINDFLQGEEGILWQRFGKEEYSSHPEPLKQLSRYSFGYKDLSPDLVLFNVSWNDLTYALANDLYLKQPVIGRYSLFDMEKLVTPRLCKSALGFFVYRALYRVMSVMIPVPGYVHRDAVRKLQGVSEGKISEISSRFANDSKKVDAIGKDFKELYSGLLRQWEGYRVATVISPSIVYSSTEDFSKVKRLGFPPRFFLVNYWSFGMGGILEKVLIRDVSRERGTDVYDMSLIFAHETTEMRNEYFADLIHLTDRGNNYLAACLLPALAPYLKEVGTYGKN
jgi:hypothetical protein